MDSFLPPVILFLIFLVAAYYVLVPFLSEKVEPVGEGVADRSTALELRKVNLYKQIREVEFEREMNLINEEDFNRTKADLLAEVAEVMRELDDTLRDQAPPVNGSATSSCLSCGIPIVPGARFCTYCGTVVGNACSGCGAVILPEDRFCTSCGRGLLN